MIKNYVQWAKEINQNEPVDSEYVWRVRGSPKNRLFLKKSQEGEQNIFINKINSYNKKKDKDRFYSWKFGTINICSGKEKLEGAKMYIIAKDAARQNLSFCALQEVRHRGTDSKIIELN